MPVASSRRGALVASAALLATPTALRGQNLVTIRLATIPSLLELPYAYALRAGLFERAGLQIDVQAGSPNGAAIASAVAGGALDIGISNVLGLAIAHARGVPFTIVAPSGVWQPNTEGGLLVAADSPLHAPADFAGKTIGCSALRDITALGVRAWLDRNGVDSNTVRFTEIPQAAAAAAIETGRIDGATVGDPAFRAAIETNKVRFVANVVSTIAPRILIVSWFSTERWVDRNRAAAERFSRVIAQASTYTNGHVSETLDDLVAFTGVERGLASRMKRAFFAPTVQLGDIQPQIDAAVKYKLIDAAFPAAVLVSDAAAR